MLNVEFYAALFNFVNGVQKPLILRYGIAAVGVAVAVGRRKMGKHALGYKVRQAASRYSLVNSFVGVCVKADTVHSRVKLNVNMYLFAAFNGGVAQRLCVIGGENRLAYLKLA